jgi:uncharacterized protein (DUF433 family)
VIEISPEVLHETPVLVGTRVLVKTLFDQLKGGDTLADVLDDFSTVSLEQSVKALEFAAENVIDASVAGRVHGAPVSTVQNFPTNGRRKCFT